MITLDFTTLVRNQVIAVQALANSVIDFSVGSVMRAITESNSSILVWLQSMITELLSASRASTSVDANLDTWVGDYGIIRMQAMFASGVVTFSRSTPSQAASIPVGSIVESADSLVQYQVVVNLIDTNYDIISDSYILPQGIYSIDTPIVATVAGTIGNVAPASINVLGTSIPGVDTVSNGIQFVNGTDSETDIALRARFVNYLGSLSKAVRVAVEYAISSTQTNLNYSITENYNYDGSINDGYFFVIIDDGTDYPSDILLTAISNSIEDIRPVCSQFGVFRAEIVSVNISMDIDTTVGYDHLVAVSSVITNITSYISDAGLGGPLRYTMLSKLAYDVPGVNNVSNISLNGSVVDLIITNKQTIRPNIISVV